MKLKQASRILCALSAAALCFLCVSAPGFAVTYHGGERGTLILNDWAYDFTTRLEPGLMPGQYRSVCTTDAAVVRVHHNLSAKWLSRTDGVVTAFGGSRSTEQPIYGTSRSNLLTCPMGTPHMAKYIRVDTNITMWGDVTVTSSITLKSDFPRVLLF